MKPVQPVTLLQKRRCLLFSPGCDVGLQICSSLWGYRGVAGNVEKNQIKSNKVGEEAQQHHWVSPEAAALVQHPKHAASCSDRWKAAWSKQRQGSSCVTDGSQERQIKHAALQTTCNILTPLWLAVSSLPGSGRTGNLGLGIMARHIFCPFPPSFHAWLT